MPNTRVTLLILYFFNTLHLYFQNKNNTCLLKRKHYGNGPSSKPPCRNSCIRAGGVCIGNALPCGSDSKKSACNEGDLVSVPGLGRSPGGGHGNPLQYSGLENPHGQRSLRGYSLWVRKESDTTERLSTHSISNRHLRQGYGWGLHRVVQALSLGAERTWLQVPG